ncbi:hypothetical protein PHYPSEUDO_003963 [Phytophthora pseudosyringae]|uniref:TKL protein kinase n=1 Tax=Phytophthora pseudosyringae TaxID=221518 RepID=A0A8T1VQG4_9STRA|nr:hypothetical protein PHYPSEUDO_003963 [Phytophthora pseudosyringae]
MVKSSMMLVLLLAQGLLLVAGSSLYKVWVFYVGKTCDGTPYNTYTERDASCLVQACTEDGNVSATGVGMASIDCTSNYKTSMRNSFGNSPFILVEVFADSDCNTLSYAQGFFASSNCEGSPNLNSTQASHVIAKLASDGSAVLEYYSDAFCDENELLATYSADKGTLATHECDKTWSKWYYVDGDDSFNADASTSAADDKGTASSHTSGVKTSTIVAIIVGKRSSNPPPVFNLELQLLSTSLYAVRWVCGTTM